MRRSGVRSLLLGVLLALVLPAAAAAHTALEWSRPADGAVLERAPAEVRLRFTQPVEIPYTVISLLGPDGAEVRGVPETRSAEGGREFYRPLPEGLPGGVYTVRWRTVAADGHPIEGTFTFTVEGEPEEEFSHPAPAEPAATPPAEHHPGPGSIPPAFASGSTLWVLTRSIYYLGLLGIVGAVGFRLLVLPLARRDPRWSPAAGEERVARAAWRFAAAALVLSLVALVARLWMQSAGLHGPEAAWEWERLRTMLTGTGWGRAWLLQAAGTILFGAGLLPARGGRGGWLVLAVAAAALSAVPALSGHAAAVEGGRAAALLGDTLHVLAAGAWLGTLAVLLLAGIPATRALGKDARPGAVAALVSAFSPLALAAGAVVAVTGVLNTLFHLSAPAQLWETEYGRVLLLKLAVLSLVIATGFYNWRVVRPRLGTGKAARELYRSAGVELAVAVVVVAVTAVLVAIPTP